MLQSTLNEIVIIIIMVTISSGMSAARFVLKNARLSRRVPSCTNRFTRLGDKSPSKNCWEKGKSVLQKYVRPPVIIGNIYHVCAIIFNHLINQTVARSSKPTFTFESILDSHNKSRSIS